MRSHRRRLASTTASYETLANRLEHLPVQRCREVQRIVRILFDEFEDAQKGKLSDKKKAGRILKLVVFGSYARNDDHRCGHRECPGTCGEYNLLVVVNTDYFASTRIWKQARERFSCDLAITGHLSAQVNFIVLSIMNLNDQLANGCPFFADIVRNGTMLYEAPGSLLVDPTPPDPEVTGKEMHRNFDHWFQNALHRFDLAKEAMKRGFDREAAFDLHQTVEGLYHCILHVLTLYNPRSHRLTFLRAHAERIAPQLTGIWPDDSRFAKRCFALLDRAYTGSRYSYDFCITHEELDWLVGRVTLLRDAVAEICLRHLNEFDCAVTWETGSLRDHPGIWLETVAKD